MMKPAVSKILTIHGLAAVVALGLIGCQTNQERNSDGTRTPQSEQSGEQGGGASGGLAQKITLSDVRPVVRDALADTSASAEAQEEARRREDEAERRRREGVHRGPASEQAEGDVSLGAASSGRSR